MIKSWGNSKSRRFYEQGKATKFRGMDIEAAEDLLASLDAATSLKDLSPLKSVGLHKLTGDRSGQFVLAKQFCVTDRRARPVVRLGRRLPG